LLVVELRSIVPPEALPILSVSVAPINESYVILTRASPAWAKRSRRSEDREPKSLRESHAFVICTSRLHPRHTEMIVQPGFSMRLVLRERFVGENGD
jgi:hypothetical protein